MEASTEGQMTQQRRIRVDQGTLAGDDIFAPIEPVLDSANIYGSPAEYEASLAPFSRAQRYCFAIEWYRREVNNGGHHQFFSNSTGIVWRDALAGFEAAGLPRFAAVLREANALLGGDPSLVRAERQAALERVDPEMEAFEALDDAYYDLEGTQKVDDTLLKYMRAHAADFEFDGLVPA